MKFIDRNGNEIPQEEVYLTRCKLEKATDYGDDVWFYEETDEKQPTEILNETQNQVVQMLEEYINGSTKSQLKTKYADVLEQRAEARRLLETMGE